MRVRTYQSELWLPASPEELFSFFGDAMNLQALTPPWLNFEILTPGPIEMRGGTLLDYRLRWHSVPLLWRTRILIWEPPHRFVDEQIRGPYRQWIHEHTFEQQHGGTLTRDHVDYAVPLDFLIHRLVVRPDVEKIFAFRERQLINRFGQRR